MLGLAVPAAIANPATQAVRSQLSNLDELPLFLPPTVGTRVAASNQLSPTGISQPSLSWIRDQLGKRYGSDRLVTQWYAYQTNAAFGDSIEGSIAYVDVIVDEQIWSLLSYFERYAFIAQFGSVAKQYGHHLRVFHTGDVFNYNDEQSSGSRRLVSLRGAYVCSFQQPALTDLPPIDPAAAADIPCEIIFNDASRREAL